MRCSSNHNKYNLQNFCLKGIYFSYEICPTLEKYLIVNCFYLHSSLYLSYLIFLYLWSKRQLLNDNLTEVLQTRKKII